VAAAALTEIRAERLIDEVRRSSSLGDGPAGSGEGLPFELAAANGAMKCAVGPDHHAGSRLPRRRAPHAVDPHESGGSVARHYV
jgi:hypothetical protein